MSDVDYTFDKVPNSLRNQKQWIVWRSEERDGDRTKVPYQPNGSYAKSTDKDTWTDFETARKAYESGQFDGVGFVFSETDPFVGVDLDDCIQGGALTSGALDVIERLGSYTEASPSGTGVHVICRGFIPHDRNRSSDVDGMKELEIYEEGRYFTMTGRHLEGSPNDIRQAGKELYGLCKDVFGTAEKNQGDDSAPRGAATLEDEHLVQKAKSGKNGDKFRRLWSGDASQYQSHSEADLALCNILAFYTGGDRSQINRLFRQSGLYREKWDRDDYRKRTIDKALEGRTEFYEPQGASSLEPQSNGQFDHAGEEDPWDPIRALYAADKKKSARLKSATTLVDELGLLTRRQSGEIFAYDWDENVHREGGEEAIERVMVNELGTHHTRHEQREVKTKAKALTYKSEIGPHPLVPVANGDLQFDPLELKDPTPDRPFFTRSPARWDPDADCPFFKKHLYNLVPAEHERQTLQEYIGYTLMHWDIPFHKALFVIGPTASGKSTTLSVVRKMLGKVASVSPQQLINGRFGPIELENAWANIRADISSDLLKDIGLFKEIVGGDPIHVERKYEQGYTIRPTAKHLYSANRLPDISIDDDAFFRRILLVSFPTTIPPENRLNRAKLDAKLEEEMDGILRWAVEGLRRVMDQNGFTHDLSPSETRRRWDEHASSIGRFKASAIEVTGDKQDFEPKEDVYTAYTSFCQDQGLSTDSQQKMTRTLKRDPRVSDGQRTPTPGGSQVRCYVGLKLKAEWASDKTNPQSSAF